jgi:hypothetical protein
MEALQALSHTQDHQSEKKNLLVKWKCDEGYFLSYKVQ